jgi:hypothetical protein
MVVFMNSLGTGACGTYHIVMPFIGRDVGLKTSSGCFADCSHAIQSEFYDGDERFFDALYTHGSGGHQRGFFPLELDNIHVAGIDDCMKDPYLFERVGSDPGFYINVLYLGPGHSRHMTENDEWRETRNMGTVLRPGETIQRTWQPVGQGWQKEGKSPPCNVAGRIDFEPVITDAAMKRDARWHNQVSARDGWIVASTERPGVVVYEVASPYLVIGAEGRAELELPAPAENQRAHLGISFDGQTWRKMWEQKDGQEGSVHAEFANDKDEAFHDPILTNLVQFRVALPPGARIRAWRMSLKFQAYVPSLPALRVGKNTIHYTDETAEPHAVEVTHRWQESCAIKPPAAPEKALLPEHDGEAGFAPTFRWAKPEGQIEAFEIDVSPREDLAWPVLAPFQYVIEGDRPEFSPTVVDALNHGQRYYWRVRARAKGGAWGPWTKTWSFVAKGPGRPRNLRAQSDDAREALIWDAPDNGRPVRRYEIYASTDNELAPRREAAAGSYANTQHDLPATLIGDTQATTFDVTDRREVFYRVVAVDDAGSRSAPTEIVALPRPRFLPGEAPPLRPGEAYRFQPIVRLSTGRRALALRAGIIRAYQDAPEFTMKAGPDWLKVDPNTGDVTGNVPDDPQHDLSLTIGCKVKSAGDTQRTWTLRLQ